MLLRQETLEYCQPVLLSDPINPYLRRLADRLVSFLGFSLLLPIFIVFLSIPSFSQTADEDIPKGLVPPPLDIISKEEKKQLEAEKKMKDRTKLAILMMEARLLKSENFLEQADYRSSLDEIGIFQGLLINTMQFLKFNENKRGVEKNYKRLEMNLRDFMPRLELIRREMPYIFGYHVKKMLFFVRDARTRALTPLFDDTVLPEGSN